MLVGISSEIGLNRKFMEFIKLLNVYLNHFPKHEKYALCSSIRNTAYKVYDLIVESQKGEHLLSKFSRTLNHCIKKYEFSTTHVKYHKGVK